MASCRPLGPKVHANARVNSAGSAPGHSAATAPAVSGGNAWCKTYEFCTTEWDPSPRCKSTAARAYAARKSFHAQAHGDSKPVVKAPNAISTEFCATKQHKTLWFVAFPQSTCCKMNEFCNRKSTFTSNAKLRVRLPERFPCLLFRHGRQLVLFFLGRTYWTIRWRHRIDGVLVENTKCRWLTTSFIRPYHPSLSLAGANSWLSVVGRDSFISTRIGETRCLGGTGGWLVW
jgi:hypothetical protein